MIQEIDSKQQLHQDLEIIAPVLLTPQLQNGALQLRQKIYWNSPGIPKLLEHAYEDQILHLDQTLCSWQKKLNAPELKLTAKKQKQWTRELVKELFPQLNNLLKTNKETDLFKDRHLEDYFNHEALPEAKLFREWLIESQLPERFHQPLELNEEVDNAENLLDLVRLYGGKTVTVTQLSREPKGEIYNRLIAKEVNTLLALAYVVTINELTKNPHEEKLLKEFSDLVSSAFSELEDYQLYMVFGGEQFKCLLSRFTKLKGSTNFKFQSSLNSSSTSYEEFGPNILEKVFNFKVRRIGNQDDQVAIFEKREKKPYSRYFKMIRNRPYPLTDTIAARFIIPDVTHTFNFMHLIAIKLNEMQLEGTPKWIFQQEIDETRSQQSLLTQPTKYFAWKEDRPDIKIEIQIDGFTNHAGPTGAVISKRYEPDTNDHAYKARQLITTVLPHFWPKGGYGFDWNDDALVREIMNHANAKALGLTATEYYRYRNPPTTLEAIAAAFGIKKKKK